MGYEVFIYKFENGDASSMPFEEVKNVLSNYGKVVEGSFGLEFIPSVGDICDFSSLSTNEEGDVLCIEFSRPTTDINLRNIIFELLGVKNTCFFGPDLGFMQSRSEMASHLPESLKEHFPSGPQIITKQGESWPLS